MIVVLAGAGASKAVNAKAYPCTVEFLKRLPDNITSNTYYQSALQFCRSDGRAGDAAVDIEEMLNALITVLDHCQAFYDKPGVTEYFFKGGLNNEHRKIVPGLNEAIQACRIMGGGVRGLVDQINAIVYNLYSATPTDNELKDTWLSLLDQLKDFGHGPVQLFTTNYDLVIESALEAANSDTLTGRNPKGSIKKLDMLWTRVDPRVSGVFTKLHGSVDWRRQGDSIIWGNPYFSGSHSQQVVLYPSSKNEPTEEPFSTFHQHFESVVAMADAVLVIGFALRDPAINRVLKYSRPPGCPLILIDKGCDPMAKLSTWHTVLPTLQSGFTSESVKQALHLIARHPKHA